MVKTAVIYARYSCDKQTEQSIEGQLRVCEEYAQRNGIVIVDTYIDEAMTGTNDNRPDFQRMIKDSAKREFDYVLVYKLDRFSRNKFEATIHKKTLKDHGVKVLSAMENIPDTPEGIILESLLEGFERSNGHKNLNLRIKAAQIQCKTKEPDRMKGSAPFLSMKSLIRSCGGWRPNCGSRRQCARYKRFAPRGSAYSTG